MLLSSSLALFLLDAMIVVACSAPASPPCCGAGATAPAAIVLALIARPRRCRRAARQLRAARTTRFAIKPVSQTRLAYVVTGNADVDSIVKAGLAGLTLFLAQRTALEAGDPVGVDPARDELSFFPLIYWPVVPGAPKPSQDALNRSTPT